MADKKKILLVEDEPLIAIREAKQLENEGYRVIVVSSGEKAVDAVREGREAFDLVLMDVDLGEGMDGTVAAREILKFHDLPSSFSRLIWKRR